MAGSRLSLSCGYSQDLLADVDVAAASAVYGVVSGVVGLSGSADPGWLDVS